MGTRAIEGDQGPDYDEVLTLEDPPHPRIPVDLGSVPIATREAQAPAGGVAGKNIVFTATDAVKLLNTDPTRGKTTLVSGNSFYLGYTKNDAETKIARIPGNTPITVNSGDAVWVLAATADTYVTAVYEYWTR